MSKSIRKIIIGLALSISITKPSLFENKEHDSLWTKHESKTLKEKVPILTWKLLGFIKGFELLYIYIEISENLLSSIYIYLAFITSSRSGERVSSRKSWFRMPPLWYFSLRQVNGPAEKLEIFIIMVDSYLMLSNRIRLLKCISLIKEESKIFRPILDKWSCVCTVKFKRLSGKGIEQNKTK